MPDEINHSYKKAKIASLVGSGVMYVLFALGVGISLVSIVALSQTDSLKLLPNGQRLLLLLSVLLPVPAILLLAEFLRHFGRGGHPFGASQSLRLLSAGALLLFYTAIDSMRAKFGTINLTGGPTPIGINDGPSISIVNVTFVVFLLCFALIVRYGNALKEDSDSIA